MCTCRQGKRLQPQGVARPAQHPTPLAPFNRHLHVNRCRPLHPCSGRLCPPVVEQL
jgi:hypothetical protein